MTIGTPAQTFTYADVLAGGPLARVTQWLAGAALLQPAPEAAVFAVGLVRGHPGSRDAGVQRPFQHHPGELGLRR